MLLCCTRFSGVTTAHILGDQLHYILSMEEDGVYVQSNRYCCLMMGIPERGMVLDMKIKTKLEDLKVLRRSPDIFDYVKIGQGQLQLIIKHILVYHIWGLQPFWSSD